MPLTPSRMVPLGSEIPEFSLPDTDGEIVSLTDFDDRECLVVMFLSNHCPYVGHIKTELAELARELMAKGAAFVAIGANDADSHPQDGPEAMKVERDEVGYPFPYLHDATQEVALAFGAACTPDFFVFDADRFLVYRGQFDASRPGNDVPVTGEDLREAILATMDGRLVSSRQTPSLGCNIKWKPGNDPDAAESGA